MRCPASVLATVAITFSLARPGLSSQGCAPGTLGDTRIFSEYKGKSYDSCVTDETLARTPSWPEDYDSPPLSPRAAIRAAREKLSMLLPDSEDWQLQEVKLTPVFPKDRWIYVIEFNGPASTPYGGSVPVPSVRLLVLMDGKVVEPRVTDSK